MGKRQQVLIGNRLQATIPRIATVAAARGIDIGPKTLCHQQAFKLKRLFRVPVFRHMGGQRAAFIRLT